MSATDDRIFVNPENEWRKETPGADGWARSARPGSPNKYFLLSADTHITPPPAIFAQQIEPRYRDRLVRITKDDKNRSWVHVDDLAPFRLVESELFGEDEYRNTAGAAFNKSYDADSSWAKATTMQKRLDDLDRDGIDAELIFPNGPALTAYWTSDADFSQAQFRIYNNWAAEAMAPVKSRMKFAACVATANVESAVKELQRVAKLGFNVVALPTQPIAGQGESLQYNDPMFEPLWAAIEDLDLVIALHVATRGDPRAVRGPGGSIMNRAASHESLVVPIAALCSSGILDRHRKLRFASVEAGIGWIPRLLDMMDETYRKHHMWVFPKLKHGLPSDYFREHGAATFQEDRSGLLLAEPYDLTGNFCWANDYPHHEGTFPHSAAAIERDFAGLREDTREKILGLNAARFFKFEISSKYLKEERL